MMHEKTEKHRGFDNFRKKRTFAENNDNFQKEITDCVA